MFRHILLPADGTEASTKAARLAAMLARRCGAKLSVLHVMEAPRLHHHSGGAATVKDIDRIEEAQRWSSECLRQVAEVIATEGATCSTVELTHAAPYLAINEFALEYDCDLIVMGSHGKHGLQRLILGSQTRKVLMTCRRPLLICP